MKVWVRATEAAASPSALLRQGLPLPISPEWVIAPDWFARGDDRLGGVAPDAGDSIETIHRAQVG